MATQSNGTSQLAEAIALLKASGIDPDKLETLQAKQAPGTRREVSTGKPVDTEGMSETEIALRARIATLEAQQSAKSGNAGQITFHVSEKGALSAYGLGRWPVTLYAEQWERLLAKSAEITAFIARYERIPEARTVNGIATTRRLADRK